MQVQHGQPNPNTVAAKDMAPASNAGPGRGRSLPHSMSLSRSAMDIEEASPPFVLPVMTLMQCPAALSADGLLRYECGLARVRPCVASSLRPPASSRRRQLGPHSASSELPKRLTCGTFHANISDMPKPRKRERHPGAPSANTNRLVGGSLFDDASVIYQEARGVPSTQEVDRLLSAGVARTRRAGLPSGAQPAVDTHGPALVEASGTGSVIAEPSRHPIRRDSNSV